MPSGSATCSAWPSGDPLSRRAFSNLPRTRAVGWRACRGERVLALAEPRDHVVQLPLVDVVAGARVRLREHAHEVAGVMTAQVSGRVFPAAGRLRPAGVQAGIEPEVPQHPIGTREDVGRTPVVARVVQDPIALLLEDAATERDLCEGERFHAPGGGRGHASRWIEQRSSRGVEALEHHRAGRERAWRSSENPGGREITVGGV